MLRQARTCRDQPLRGTRCGSCQCVTRSCGTASTISPSRCSTLRRPGGHSRVQVCGPDVAARRGLVAIGCSSSADVVFGCSRRLQCWAEGAYAQPPTVWDSIAVFSREVWGCNLLRRGCGGWSGWERSDDPKLWFEGQLWWSFAAWLCASPSRPSMVSRQRRVWARRSMIRATQTVGSAPVSCPRSSRRA